MKLYTNAATGAALLSAASFFLSVEARVGQAHEVEREEGFPEQALLQTLRQVNCNIKFPSDAKVEYVSRGDTNIFPSRCELLPGYGRPFLRNDAPNGIWGATSMWCEFKVKFSDGNGCSCGVETFRQFPFQDVVITARSYSPIVPVYRINHYNGCECMRITRCEGDRCPGDGNTGEWPCDGSGCTHAPDVTLTVESSWNK